MMDAKCLKGLSLSDGVLGIPRIRRTRGNFRDIFWSNPKLADTLQYNDIAWKTNYISVHSAIFALFAINFEEIARPRRKRSPWTLQ